MKKVLVLLVVVFCAALAVAQDAPKAEVFGGYQFTSIDTKGATDRQSAHGWDADVAFNFNQNFGFVADISGAYKNNVENSGADARLYNYLFGPRVSVRGEKVTAFGEALVGANHVSLGASGVSVTSNGFAFALGGGIDVNASKRVAIRLAKFDYLLNHVSSNVFGVDDNLNNYRFATGIVFKF